MNVWGIEHVGITVPDIEAASEFLEAAFGAEVIYDLHGSGSPEAMDEYADSEQDQLGIRPGASWVASRMLRLGNGANVELFEFADDERRPAVTASDIGIQHLAIYVDDIDEARQKVIDAGGKALSGPYVLRGLEGSANGDDGNRWNYTLTPWGSIVELIAFPSPQAYEDLTSLRRWRPERPQGGDR